MYLKYLKHPSIPFPHICTMELFISFMHNNNLSRPGHEFQEICENPVLFSEGTTRFDIGQGSAGTCWFLSVLASLADKPGIISQVGYHSMFVN